MSAHRSRSSPERDGERKRQRAKHWNDRVRDYPLRFEDFVHQDKYKDKMTVEFLALLHRINKDYQVPMDLAVETTTEQISAFQGLPGYGMIVLTLNGLLSMLKQVEIYAPSTFSKHDNWTHHQEGINPHLCFRPASKSGLPLEIIHPAFSLFKHLLSVPFPSGEEMASATVAASNLCRDMAGGHAKEETLGRHFMTALSPLFPQAQWTSQFQCSMNADTATYAKLDGVFAAPKSRLLGQWNHASGGDPYMQLAHSFWWFALRDQMGNPDEEHQQHGSPTILFLVQGINLMIAGGYYDGTLVTLEPLAPVQTMLLDRPGRIGNRIDSLARHLYAVKLTHDYLQSYDFMRDPAPLPGIPHPSIYPSITYGDQEYKLRFQEPPRTDSSRLLPLLLWAGILEPCAELPSIPVVIKLVYGEYGENVHSCLARHDLAPRLYGIIHGEVPNHSQAGLSQTQNQTILPRAVVMEFLHKRSFERPGWITVHQLLQGYRKGLSTDVQTKIFTSLVAILNALQKDNLVHGDLRAGNIMINLPKIPRIQENYQFEGLLADEVELKVIDFEWGGDAGRVKYSLYRNEQGIDWPGKRGMPIECTHDSSMVKSWWAESFPDFDFTRF